jgi:hypothetical protein
MITCPEPELSTKRCTTENISPDGYLNASWRPFAAVGTRFATGV